MNARFDRWCRAAVDQIRYGPDRKHVYDELYAHLEDRYEAELDRWETPEEAMEATLKAMGSASELAPQLAAVHRPFWGYVLEITRCVLGCSLVFLALSVCGFFLYNRAHETYVPWFYQNPGEALVNVWEDGEGESVRVLDYNPDATATSDGFRFDATRAVLVFSDHYTEDQRDAFYFWFQIEVSSVLYWDLLQDIPHHDFRAVDSLGNEYCSFNDNIYTDEPYVSGNRHSNGPFRCTMDLWLSNFCSEDAQWVEIIYDRDGRDIRLRIDLTGGEDQ